MNGLSGIVPCSIIIPYYENVSMLEMQVAAWEQYCGELMRELEFIVVDDCSRPGKDAAPIMKKLRHRKKVFRVKKKWPWNQHMARNIGVQEAVGSGFNKSGWPRFVFLTDVDIILPADAAMTMLSKKLNPGNSYTVERVFAPEFSEHKTHANTILCTREAFLHVGGYCLDLNPIGGGGYGGDAECLRRIAAVCPQKHLKDVVTVGYGRRSKEGTPTVEDADTTDPTYDREEWSKKYRARFDELRSKGPIISKNPIRGEYEQVL